MISSQLKYRNYDTTAFHNTRVYKGIFGKIRVIRQDFSRTNEPIKQHNKKDQAVKQ